MHKSSLGIHEIKLVVKPPPGLSNGCGVGEHADSPLHLSQVPSSHQQWCLEGTWLRCRGLSACSPTPQPLLRPGGGLTTSLISCMPRELLCIGMWEREWKKVNLVKLVKIWLLLRKIMRK